MKCVFCGVDESPYKGVTQINNDGTMSFFCSGKCRKNALNLKRDKKKLKWTEAYRISKQRIIDQAKMVSDKAEVKKAESEKSVKTESKKSDKK